MKNLKFLPIVFIAFFALTLTSCTKDPEDRLPGDAWDITASFGGLAVSGKITFNEDGTGTITMWDESDEFVWSATETTVTLDGEVFQIIENKRNEQIWEATEDGMTVTYTLTR